MGIPLKDIKNGVVHVKITDPQGESMHLPDVDMCTYANCPLRAFTKYKYFDDIPIIVAESGEYTVRSYL